MAVSYTRIYVAAWKTTIGLNSKVFVFDHDGIRKQTEEFSFSNTSKTVGLAFHLDRLYQLQQLSSLISPFLRVIPYNLQGVGSTAIDVGAVSSVTPYSPYTPIYGFTILDNKVYILFNSAYNYGNTIDRVSRFGFPSFGYDNSSIILPQEILVPAGLAPRTGGFYIGGTRSNNTDHIWAFDTGLSAVTGDDIPIVTGLGTIRDMAWSGYGLYVLNTNDDIFIYGTEVPLSPTQPFKSRMQYQGFEAFEERWDIVGINNNAITAVRAADIRAIRETNLENFSISRQDVSLTAQLSVINVVPKWTIETLEPGDVIFLHTGPIGADPTVIPTQRWTIEGISGAGETHTQTLVCKAVTS